jgi:hypothetical protein
MPGVSSELENLPVIAEREQTILIGGDLNDGPCHATFL